MTNRPEVILGTAVWIRKEGKVMLSVRTKEKGFGTWCPPGGHVELRETLVECAIREVGEEAQVEIENLRFIDVTEDSDQRPGVLYLTFHYAADWKSGEPQALEGENGEWSWHSWDDLPGPFWRPADLFVKKNINPLEYKG